MPELPEVETITNELNHLLKGKRVKDIQILKEKSFQGDPRKIIGRKIKSVRRRAKLLIFEFSDSPYYLLGHLKMTGQLIFDEKFQIPNSKFQNQHTRVTIKLDRGILLFNDLRIFGWLRVVNQKVLDQELSKYGPDVTDKQFTVGFLTQTLRSTRRPVKLTIMDQQKLSGIGNIYASEILFCAGIYPETISNELAGQPVKVKKLHRCISQIIQKGIHYGGITAGDDRYINAKGNPGRYQNHRLVYDREGESCRRCGTAIKKMKLGARGTYWCPRCQL